MTASAEPVPMSSGAPEWVDPRPFVARSLAAAAVGLGLLVLGLVVDPRRTYFSYLQVWTFGTTVCWGGLVLLMVDHASKASWMVVTRRMAESIVAALPLYLALFVPIAFGLGFLYPWAERGGRLDPGLLRAIEHKRSYLNPAFFVVRTIGYFAVAISIGALLRRWSKANDTAPRLMWVRRMRMLSGAGLPIIGLTLTWASFDWTMSLEPDWVSTIFGLYYFAGAFVGAIALVCVMLHLFRMRPSLGLCVTPDHAQAMGRILFAMICFWAYQAFSQLLIDWIGDIPEEIGYYKLRTTGTWWGVTLLLIFGHFVVPFFALIQRKYKRRTRYLAILGGWMFLMHFVDVYWLVMPNVDPAGVRPHWLDLAAVLFVGGLSSGWIVNRYFHLAPLPIHDPELAAGLSYEASR
ncbi:MAG: hypothetical protein ABSC94_02200 [Polyangiaceae bacterium]|jgi:hypothetical protein